APGTLIVTLWSLTGDDTANPDHALQIFVNGTSLGAATTWDGANQLLNLSFNIPAGALSSGLNDFELVTPVLPNVASQTPLLHSLTVKYTQALSSSAPSQPVVVNTNGVPAKVYEVTGLTTNQVWVVDARLPDRATTVPCNPVAQGNGTWKVQFQGLPG